MITKEQFEAAKFVANIKDDHDEFTSMSYEQYIKVVEELERLNGNKTPPGSTCVVCVKDPAHDVEVTCRGTMTTSSKTGAEIDSDWRDEWYECPVCKDDANIVDFVAYEGMSCV